MDMLWFILGGIALVVILAMVLYNRLVALRQSRKNAFADIDVHLKQRADLVPNLVETVKAYAKHEQGVLTELTEARTGVSAAQGTEQRITAEAKLGSAMMHLFAVAENYPDLKANQNFQQLQKELADIENKLAAARRFFNNATAEYNTVIEQFPSNVVARLFHFQQAIFFELTATQRDDLEQAPKLDF